MHPEQRGIRLIGATSAITPAGPYRTPVTRVCFKPRTVRSKVVARMGAFLGGGLVSFVTHKVPPRLHAHLFPTQVAALATAVTVENRT